MSGSVPDAMAACPQASLLAVNRIGQLVRVDADAAQRARAALTQQEGLALQLLQGHLPSKGEGVARRYGQHYLVLGDDLVPEAAAGDPGADEADVPATLTHLLHDLY